MNILLLAAGQDQTTQEDGYPLCLTEFEGVPLIQRVTTACMALKPDNFIVAFRHDDIRRYHLDQIVTLISSRTSVLAVHESTQGAACTALLAARHIDNEKGLLIVNGNELLDTGFCEIVSGFRERQLDAGVVVFHSIHPRYSYVRTDEHGLVVEATEKRPISTNATAGFYWFARGQDFVRAAKNLIRKDARVNGRFFICPTLNELILENKRVGVHPLPNDRYHPLKTGRQVEQFEAVVGRGKAE